VKDNPAFPLLKLCAPDGLSPDALPVVVDLGTMFVAAHVRGVSAAALLYSEFGGDNSTIGTLHAVREALAVIAGIATLYAALGIRLQPWNVNRDREIS
jgi:hypothetical protein